MSTDPEVKLQLIEEIVEGFTLDDNPGDTCERIETILYVTSDGRLGKDWGFVGMPLTESEV